MQDQIIVGSHSTTSISSDGVRTFTSDWDMLVKDVHNALAELETTGTTEAYEFDRKLCQLNRTMVMAGLKGL